MLSTSTSKHRDVVTVKPSGHLEAVEKVIKEDGPAAPHAQHTQDMSPQPLLCHTAVTRSVSLLQQAP